MNRQNLAGYTSKKFITFALVFVIIGLLAFIVIGSKNKARPQSETANTPPSETIAANNQERQASADILYWGNTCPHCHDTIEWIEENKIEEKITIIRKEVYANQQNAFELTQKAKSCGIDENSIGVPLMFTADGKCLVGTPDITGYLQEKTQ